LSPMRNPRSEAELPPQPTQALEQSREPVIAGSAAEEAFDLLRLQSSVQWLRRECTTLDTTPADVGERPQTEPQRLPRAQQLAPIPGLAELMTEVRRNSPAQPAARIDLAAPRIVDRLVTPPPQREQALTRREAIYILLAAVIAGLIGYHLASDGGLLAALGPALAASTGG
jgi:hypothetical protein